MIRAVYSTDCMCQGKREDVRNNQRLKTEKAAAELPAAAFKNGGPDEARTRDLRRDRPAF